MYLGVGLCPWGVGITEHPVPASPQRMEKEYGVPWLRKRVPVGTWVKGCSW